MSPFLLSVDEMTELPAGYAHELRADLLSYQEHLAHDTPVVLAPRSGSITQDGLRPDAYRITTTDWGGEVRTPVYTRQQAHHRRLRPHWTKTDQLATETADRLREEFRDDDASIAFLAGRTAQCCGRISELAIFDSAGEPIFDQALAPHNGERWNARGVEEFWRCAREHQPPEDSWAPFSHWARQLGLVLNYYNRNHALEIPSLTAQGGRARSHVVVWGGDLLQALHREYVFAHGRPRNGKLQKVKDELVAVSFCDLQLADLLWRGAWPGGIAEFAHLDGATAGDDCRLMHQHLRRLTQRPRRAEAGADRLPRASAFPVGPPPSFVMAAAPSADTLAEREGWKFSRGRFTPAGASRRPRTAVLPVQEPIADPEALSAVTGLDLEGASDVVRVATQRREQGKLRRYLLGHRTSAECSLCGRTFPVSYLRVAHIKRREDADEAERRDPAIVMIACVLGCDAFFEQGEVYVDEHGMIRARPTPAGSSTDLPAALKALEGLRCAAHSPLSERYFHAHRQRHGHSSCQFRVDLTTDHAPTWGWPLHPGHLGPTAVHVIWPFSGNESRHRGQRGDHVAPWEHRAAARPGAWPHHRELAAGMATSLRNRPPRLGPDSSDLGQ
ncbi:hypothetical protein [Streptosporangium sp. CA-115845]|uniref:hypothetical protein n=1 Tax=Streptosporangium sp. CA-115845 TaxID=3240071 RepID=UPI003D8DE22F